MEQTIEIPQLAGWEPDDMAEWVKRAHGKGAIDRAGEMLVPWWISVNHGLSPDEITAAYEIIQNWRASHAMPLLTFRMALTKRARRVESNIIIAQRMKRFSSVMNKLAREPHMKLSQMQDLGGCRAIVSGTGAVYDLFGLYIGGGQTSLFDTSEGSLKFYDYIQKPKDDGYRGIHVVGRYRARLEKNEPWNGQRIEVQLRTRLQHAFATAVETVTTFTRFQLKFGSGPTEWRRFFALVGSAFAWSESTPTVNNTPADAGELRRELEDLTKSLKVRQRLRGWARALRRLPRRNTGRFSWLLLALNVKQNTIKVTGFTDAKKARAAIDELEKTKSVDGDIDAVLVWVKSAQDLTSAYPNYYADTREFIHALDVALQK